MAAPTLIGQAPTGFVSSGRIRAAIKLLTVATAGETSVQAIYDAGIGAASHPTTSQHR